MAAVRQLAGERKGLGSGAQSARQANSLLANLQAAGVDRPRPPRRRRSRRRRRRDSCGGCAVAAAAALAVGPRAPRGGCGRRRRWCDGRTKRGRARCSTSGAERGAGGTRISRAECALLFPPLKAPPGRRARGHPAPLRRRLPSRRTRHPYRPPARCNNILSVRRIILAPQRRASPRPHRPPRARLPSRPRRLGVRERRRARKFGLV